MATYDPPAHLQILAAARRCCDGRGRFALRDVVRALPHIRESTVRTHVVSRCCVDAPQNHEHTWDYFSRVDRGVYAILRPYRSAGRGKLARVAKARAEYVVPQDSVRDTVHAIVIRSASQYVGECLEIGVTTQGTTLDELVANLREAVSLHLEGEDARIFGLVAEPRLSITYELQP